MEPFTASSPRSLVLALLLAALAGCGGHEPRPSQPSRASRASSPPAAARASAPPPRSEPLEAAAAPSAPAPFRRGLWTLEGAPADAPVEVEYLEFRAPESVLRIGGTGDHETLLLVLEHELEVSPLLAGGHDAPVVLEVGGAIRIPPGTPAGQARWSGRGSAEALHVRVRCGAGLPCSPAPIGSARGQITSFRTTPEHSVAGGSLWVRILFPLVAEERTGASLALLEAQPGTVVPRHVHETSAEIVLIERGSGVMHLGDRQLEVAPGTSIYIPPNTPHDLTLGSAPLRAWQIYTPSGPEMRFRSAPPAPAR